MNASPAILSVPFTTQWVVRRPYVYRYLDRQFVDAFFKDGSLRISSFVQFSKHDDEERNDTQEGFGVSFHTNATGEGQTIAVVARVGRDAYVLCGSQSHNSELATAFETNSGFRINDILGFSHAVSRRLPYFAGGMEGNCLYPIHRHVVRDIGKVDIQQVASTGDLANLGELANQVTGHDLFFLKDRKYAHQNEYRLVWLTGGVDVEPYIDIKCPEAIQFCNRFEDLESGHVV